MWRHNRLYRSLNSLQNCTMLLIRHTILPRTRKVPWTRKVLDKVTQCLWDLHVCTPSDINPFTTNIECMLHEVKSPVVCMKISIAGTLMSHKNRTVSSYCSLLKQTGSSTCLEFTRIIEYHVQSKKFKYRLHGPKLCTVEPTMISNICKHAIRWCNDLCQ